MSATRCVLLGSLAALLLALAACAGNPASPPPDRTPLATIGANSSPAPRATATETAVATPTAESSLMAALGPLGLSSYAGQPSAAPSTRAVPPTATPAADPAGDPPDSAAVENESLLAAPGLPPPSPIPAPTPTPVAVPVPPAAAASASTVANLRAGPGLDYPIIGSAPTGSSLDVVACNADRTWFKLANGAWIFADLVSNSPRALQVVDASDK